MRASRLRVSVVVAAFVFLGVAPAYSQSDPQVERPVILFAAVSPDGATVHVSGIDIPDEPFVTLGGILLGGVTVVREPDVDRLTVLMPALLPGSYRLTLSDKVPDGTDQDLNTRVNFDITIGIAERPRAIEGTCGGECAGEQPPAN